MQHYKSEVTQLLNNLKNQNCDLLRLGCNMVLAMASILITLTGSLPYIYHILRRSKCSS